MIVFEHDLVFCICVHMWKSVSGVCLHADVYVCACLHASFLYVGVDVCQLPNPSGEKPCVLVSEDVGGVRMSQGGGCGAASVALGGVGGCRMRGPLSSEEGALPLD